MKIIRGLEEMQQQALILKKKEKKIGFVPTMGFLHEGHESLMKLARAESDILIVSIFVNPLQFGPNEDFSRYPRDEKKDRETAEANKVDFLFIPDTKDMYPDEQSIVMRAVKRTDVLCGRSREGHFDGVATVLAKLFHLTFPDQVYFGMKDAQQLAVVDSLIQDYNFPIRLVPVQTVREKDGLAKSSRNVYLSEKERQEAKYLYKALQRGRELIVDGERNPAIIVNEVETFLREHTSAKIEYVEILVYPELTPVAVVPHQCILAVAIQFGKARLIDNIIMTKEGNLSVSI